jgi:hypothetical protein
MRNSSRDEFARVLVKVGAVIAGADGLAAEEKAALVAYASKRADIPASVIEDLVSQTKGGPESITDAEIALLKGEGLGLVGQLLHEELAQIAGAEGKLSDREIDTLNAIWARLSR